MEPECLLLGNLLRNSAGARLSLPRLTASRGSQRSTAKPSALPSPGDRLSDLSGPQAETGMCVQPKESRVLIAEHCYVLAGPPRPPRAFSHLSQMWHSALTGSKVHSWKGSGCGLRVFSGLGKGRSRSWVCAWEWGLMGIAGLPGLGSRRSGASELHAHPLPGCPSCFFSAAKPLSPHVRLIGWSRLLAILGQGIIPHASFPRRGVHTDPEPPEELLSLQPQRPAAESLTACCMEGFYGRGPYVPGGCSLAHRFPWANAVCAKCLRCAENVAPVPEAQGILFGPRAMCQAGLPCWESLHFPNCPRASGAHLEGAWV